jgi:hypothetical protein
VKFFSRNQFIRGFSGDVIIIFLIYFLIKSFLDFNELKLAIFILIIAFLTEFLQYLKLTAFFELENNKIAQLLLGSVFDPYDLIAYTIGAILVYFIDTRIVRKVSI